MEKLAPQDTGRGSLRKFTKVKLAAYVVDTEVQTYLTEIGDKHRMVEYLSHRFHLMVNCI